MDAYQQDSFTQIKPKIYTKKAIEIGTALGGPYVAGYLLSSNFKIFGEPEKAKNALILGIVFTILLALSIFYLPKGIEDKIPNELIPLINGFIAYLLVKKYQDEQIEKYLQSGGEKAKWWKVAQHSLVGVIVFVIPAILFYYLTQSSVSLEVMKFGKIGHEIYYDPKNVHDVEVKYLGDNLSTIGIFNDHNNKMMVFKLKQVNSNYEVSFLVNDNAWNDVQSVALGRAIRDSLQSFYSKRMIILNYVSPSFDDVKLSFGQGYMTNPK